MALDPAHRLALGRTAIVAALEGAEREALLFQLRPRTLAPGEVLFRQGDAGDTLVIVAEGRLGVVVKRPSGVEVELAEAGPGELVGEMALLDPASRAATVIALVPAVVYLLSREGFDTLRRRAPEVATAVVSAVVGDVARRLREVDARIAAALAETPPPPAPEPAAMVAPAAIPRPESAKSGLMRLLDLLRRAE